MSARPGRKSQSARPNARAVSGLRARAAGSVRNVLGGLWRDKLLHRAADKRVVLTERGLRTAIQTASAHLE
jgi:hypothetical protein